MSVFLPHEKAPDFIKLNLSINKEQFTKWLAEQQTNEKGYVKIDLKKSKNGNLYLALNDYGLEKKEEAKEVPF